MNEEGRIHDVVSESNLIHLMRKHLPEFDSSLINSTVRDLKFGFKEVIKVEEAFQKNNSYIVKLS